MTNDRKPKWEISATISAGNNAYTAAIKYRTDLEPRLQPDELEQLKANNTELEARRSGQTEHLVGQKSKTISQGDIATQLRNNIVSIRNIVKSNSTATPDIIKAFGVGEKVNHTISTVVAGGNIVVSAYKENTAWSNNAGIIETDIAEISHLVSRLTRAEELQGNAMFTRKSKTMDKNILQRAVEDEVSKISALGQHVFLNRDAAVAKLFEDLIPSINKVKTENPTKNKNITEENVTV
ncbi:MAG: hypothetical protein HXX16_18275 [Bacteroidales bacterium]|nr:hypothetical protein [Bacteroidales bacterium]